MTDSARKHIHISHSVTNVFAFKFQNGKMELGRQLKICVKSQISFTLCLIAHQVFVLTFSINNLVLPKVFIMGFPGGLDGKESVFNAGDLGLISGSGRSPPWRREWQLLQYSCLENSMDGGVWQAIIHGVTKRQT